MRDVLLIVIMSLAVAGCGIQPPSSGPKDGEGRSDAAPWIDAVPDMLPPLQPARPANPLEPRPTTPKALSERTEEFAAIVLAEKLEHRIQTVGDRVYVGILKLRVEEAFKGSQARSGELLEVAMYKYHRRDALNKMLTREYEQHLKRGIIGLKALPDGAPISYAWLWFHVPAGDNWKPISARFREDVERKRIAQQADKALWEQHRDVAQSRVYTWLRRSHWNSEPWYVDGESLVYEKNKLVALRYHMAHGMMNVKDSMDHTRTLERQKQPNLLLEYSFVDQEWILVLPKRENARPRKDELPSQAVDGD
jgi:hypothetical protein